MDFGGGDEIRFERAGALGIVTLTRPKALNALTHRMVKALALALSEWEADPNVATVVLKAEGRAFCAGGDIMDVYRARQTGAPAFQFFADEYRLNAHISRFSKPYVSLIDGIVMGGGVGISCHGSHRVMTENAQFAMPEVGIGFFPDVGGSHLLPDLGESFGMYLGLTGARIRYGDALWSGIATHTTKAELLPGLLERMAAMDEPEAALREVFSPARRETEPEVLRAIGRHFSKPTLSAVMESLRRSATDGDAFAEQTLATVATKSPTSLAVTFQSITRGSRRSMDDCMRMEYRILRRMLDGHDLYEGIRCALVDKGDKPRWRPDSLDDVSDADVEAHFAPLDEGEL
ncbi:MAG: enoyl-CoA hydratase/isomerase family protein, partial [Rhizobiaceae bacterium]|nr:enoyl-CoA hydratase/isomerase family protein [Rhizobiaceae bacterium]